MLKKTVKAQSLLGFDYILQLSTRRKTVALEVRPAGVFVLAPTSICLAWLDDWLRERRVWVEQKMLAQQQRLQESSAIIWRSGMVLPYRGHDYVLKVLEGPAEVKIQGTSVCVGLGRSVKPESDRIKDLLTAWLRQQAEQVLTEKTHALADKIQRQCGQVTIRLTKSKWGHCTSKGNIQYSWPIMLAPESVIDYLVAHEVSHLRHANHGAQFWSLVCLLHPTAMDDRQWLKRHGHQLRI